MLKIAQFMSVLVALIFIAGGAVSIFNPEAAASARNFEPIGEFGITNLRLLAAPFLMIAVAAIAAAIKKNPVFLGPAVLFLMFGVVIQIGGLIVDGSSGDAIKGLIATIVMLIVAEIPVQLFNRVNKNETAA